MITKGKAGWWATVNAPDGQTDNFGPYSTKAEAEDVQKCVNNFYKINAEELGKLNNEN